MKKKSIVVSILSLIMFCNLLNVPAEAAGNNRINILLNGRVVKFTGDSGYPYVDENNRTMVPLRVTMESAGFAVGYDSTTDTAIVITEHNRIEVPIGTNTVYANNKLTENDTNAVVKNGRTYLPIRVVLEKAGYTVGWDNSTGTVNAYTFVYNENEFVPYSTSSLATLVDNVLKGNVVYVNGQYYATPDYVKMFTNVQVNYLGDDLNKAIYPEESRYDLADFNESQIEWVGGLLFEEVLVNDKQIEKFGVKGKASEIPGYSYIYAFYDQGSSNTEIVYPVNEMTEEFMKSSDATGTFNGIRMKKENGILYFNYSDIKERNIKG